MSIKRQPGPRVRLDGLALIADYMQLSVNQVKRLYKITVPEEDRLPVFTLSPGPGKNGRLAIYVDELNAWMDKRPDMRMYRQRQAAKT